MNPDDIKKYLQQHLSEFRYSHSLRVAAEAFKLGSVYQIDQEKAYLVGLVHDVANEFSEADNLFWIKKYHLSEQYLRESYKNILHSDIGALVARELFSFDSDMCQAIKYHTTGNTHMNLFDKVLFIADKVGRKQLAPPMEKVKELAYLGDLEQSLILYFEFLQEQLKVKKLTMSPDSYKMLQWLKKNHMH